MADLTPRTRSESFLNGEDLEPITRREHFYAGRENDLPEGHQEPETREEWFIQKYREAGDVTVESLSITENGTYTAPSGKAYSPVSVNVPLPSNAYLLKSIEHESIATFADGTDNFVKALEVAIEPVQEGSGDPSPTNIRPISGWDECKVTVADDLENPTVSNVYTIDLDGTRYGGKLDVVSGVMVVEWIAVSLGNINYTKSQSGLFQTNEFASAVKKSSYSYVPTGYIKSSHFREIDSASITGPQGSNPSPDGVMAVSGAGMLYFNYWAVTDVADFKTAMASATLVYELATPLTIQLTPTIIKSLQGNNDFFASTGEIELLQYWGR